MSEFEDYERMPDETYRFFLYDPDSNALRFYKSAEDRAMAAKEFIESYLDDVWNEEVEGMIAGEVIITHCAQQTNRKDKPAKLDEDDCDEEGNIWNSEWDYMCNYELLPINKEVSHES